MVCRWIWLKRRNPFKTYPKLTKRLVLPSRPLNEKRSIKIWNLARLGARVEVESARLQAAATVWGEGPASDCFHLQLQTFLRYEHLNTIIINYSIDHRNFGAQSQPHDRGRQCPWLLHFLGFKSMHVPPFSIAISQGIGSLSPGFDTAVRATSGFRKMVCALIWWLGHLRTPGTLGLVGYAVPLHMATWIRKSWLTITHWWSYTLMECLWKTWHIDGVPYRQTKPCANMLHLVGMGFQILRHPEMAKENHVFFPSFEPYLSKQNQHFQAFRVCENLHAAFWRKACEFSNGNATAAKVCFNSGIRTLSLSITKPWLLTVAALLKLGGRGHGVNMGQQMPDAGVIISPQRAWGFLWTYSWGHDHEDILVHTGDGHGGNACCEESHSSFVYWNRVVVFDLEIAWICFCDWNIRQPRLWSCFINQENPFYFEPLQPLDPLGRDPAVCCDARCANSLHLLRLEGELGYSDG